MRSKPHDQRAQPVSAARSDVLAGREVINGFMVLGLPRSRTAWLSQFLSYGDWICGHEELRHMRSLSDVKAWFDQPCIGTAETSAAPWWRLFDRYAPGCRIVTVRRPIEEVLDSFGRLFGPHYDRETLRRAMERMDRKLDQIETRRDVLRVEFADLADEETCAKVFEYCLPYQHDQMHWRRLSGINVQINMAALVRYCAAYLPAMEKLADTARKNILSDLARRPVVSDGITYQVEDFDTWLRDAKGLIEDHLILVGEAPGDWQDKNLTLMRQLADAGGMQIMTARSNGRMFGYLMTIIGPSMTGESNIAAYNAAFYADESAAGVGMKLQRASLVSLKEKGVRDVFYEAGKRASGPRLGTMYRRLGAEDHGQVYRLQLTEV